MCSSCLKRHCSIIRPFSSNSWTYWKWKDIHVKAVSLSSAAERLRTQSDGWAELRGKVKRAPGVAAPPAFLRRGTEARPHLWLSLPPSLRLHGPPGGAGGRLSARHGGVSGAEPPCSRPPRRRQPSAAPLRSAPALLPAAAAQGTRMPRRQPPRPLLLLSALLCAPASAFNLDEEKLTVYSGPPGSYFGYSVDFYIPDPSTWVPVLAAGGLRGWIPGRGRRGDSPRSRVGAEPPAPPVIRERAPQGQRPGGSSPSQHHAAGHRGRRSGVPLRLAGRALQADPLR